MFLKKNSTLPEEVDFQHLALPKTPNYFLLVPPGFTTTLTDPQSPIFDVPVETLEAAWKVMIKKQSRIQFRSFSEEKRRYHYLTKSLIFRFPSYLIVQFIPVSETQSTVAMYQYSIYGTSDFGVNRLNGFRLLIALKKRLNAA